MTLKRVIDADKISADQLFLRKSASRFSLLIVAPERAECYPALAVARPRGKT